jgi:soluble cytochrome b562
MARAFQDRPTRALREVLAADGSLARTMRRLRESAERAARLSRDQAASGRDGLDPEARSRRERDSRQERGRQIDEEEDAIQELVEALDGDRQVLELDNAALAQQERALWTEIRTLREYAVLAGRLDDLLEERIQSIEGADPVRARALRTEALYAVRRRRRDVLLQLAVATQGYGALRLIEQDNLEVVWAIRAATTTTITALRSAALAAQASPGRLADQLEAAGLRGGWDEVIAALDEVDARAQRTLQAVDASGS